MLFEPLKDIMMNIIYLRTSTEEQSPGNQLTDVLEIAPHDCIVIEEKQSAWKDHLHNRPLFKKVYDDIKKGNIKGIYVWDLDRLYRNRIKCVEFIKLCQYKKVKIKSYRQQWLNELQNIPAPFNEIISDLMIQIVSWIAEEESNKKSDRIKIAFKNHKKDNWGRPQLKLDVDQVKLLRDSGKSLREIATILKVSKSKIHVVVNKH